MKMPKPDAEVIARRKQIVGALRDIVPGEGVIDEVDELRAYECDGLTAYRELPLIVVLPTTVEQVSKVLAYCLANGIKVVPRGAGTSLSGGALPLADAVTLGLGKFTAHDGNAFDEFRQPLHKQDRECERYEEFCWPLRQASIVGGLLVLQKGGDEERPGRPHDDRGHRQQEQRMADDLDRIAQPARIALVQDVDADVLVQGECPRSSQEKYGAEQPPLQLEPGIRAGIEELANDRIARTDEGGHDDEPRNRSAESLGGSVDKTAHLQQCPHDAPSLPQCFCPKASYIEVRS